MGYGIGINVNVCLWSKHGVHLATTDASCVDIRLVAVHGNDAYSQKKVLGHS